VSLHELDLQLRELDGVLAVGFVESDGFVVVEVEASRTAPVDLARDAVIAAMRCLERPVAVEVVRRNDEPRSSERRLRLVDVTTDPAGGEVSVHLAYGDESAVGRASTAHGLRAVVEATVYAVRTYLPDLTYLPGWARTVETTPERRFLVVASVTDPLARSHLRGVAEGNSPLDAGARATLAALNRTISRELVRPRS
jgi:hypothetical protein